MNLSLRNQVIHQSCHLGVSFQVYSSHWAHCQSKPDAPWRMSRRDSQKYARDSSLSVGRKGLFIKANTSENLLLLKTLHPSGHVVGSTSTQFCLYLITLRKCWVSFQLKGTSLGWGWDGKGTPEFLNIQNRD